MRMESGVRCGIAGEENLEVEVRLGSFDVDHHMVGDHRLGAGRGGGEILRAGVLHAHRIGGSEVDLLGGRHAALAHFAAGEVNEGQGISRASGGFQIGLAAAFGQERGALGGVLVQVEFGLVSGVLGAVGQVALEFGGAEIRAGGGRMELIGDGEAGNLGVHRG